MKKSQPKECQPIALVYETTDYDWFKFLENNRRTDHVNALIESFKQRDVPNAILCNEDGYIIDGQNRFLARKELGLPIFYYCIEGLDIYDVAFLNSYGKNWSPQDFVEMWAGLGSEEYTKIKKFRDMFPDFPMSSILMLLNCSSTRQMGKITTDDKWGGFSKNKLKLGEFTVKNLDLSVYLANCIMQYKPFARPGTQIYRHQSFISAMIQLLVNGVFDNAEMVRRAGMYPDMFYKCINAENYVVMLQELWNRKRRTKVIFPK